MSASYNGWVNGILKQITVGSKAEAILTAPGMCGLTQAGATPSVCDATVVTANCNLAPALSNCRALYLSFCSNPQRTCDI